MLNAVYRVPQDAIQLVIGGTTYLPLGPASIEYAFAGSCCNS